MKKYLNGEYIEMTTEEIEELEQAQKEWEEQEKKRPLTLETFYSFFLNGEHPTEYFPSNQYTSLYFSLK